ncbi:MAG: ComEC/Rec2 family competence protein, partial [Phycisphaerae bacterium]|nr:ComEC/Rec2 family competence protein [Phycisphaerae bacterium]
PRAHLLEALLLGRRTRDAAATDDRFRRIGLAHLLAISGMHLGIVVAMVLGLSRLAGGGPRLEGLVILLAVGGYLFLVETRLPVVRAGVMAACFGLGRLLGRRGRLDGIVAFGGVALLAARPDDLFRAGFQLSFAVVFGLVYLTPTVRRRWFGPPRRDLAGPVAMLRERSRDAIAAAVVAWVVATPIIMYHFGILSPLTVPLSLIALPFVTAVLGLGYAAMLLDPLLPSVAATLEPVLRGVTDMLLTIAQIADATPGASVNVIPPPAVWTIGMGVWTWVWGRTPNASSRRRRRVVTVTGAMLVAGYATVGVPHPWRPALRLDMLAVSDGSSILLGCGRERLLFDAGSMSHPDAGRTRIVPALRRLGVRRLNAIAVSHPDLDHYSAVLEVVDAFPVDAVLLTPAFRRHARRDTSGPEAFLLAALRRRGCPTETIVAGDARRLGGATLRWRHPDRDDVFDADNDGSMVVDIDVAGRRVLLTGDLDRDGIATLLSRHPFLRADVVELPHHGSAGPAVTRLIEHVDPRYLLQSTGPRRLRKDAIADAVAGRTRLVTARDGASTVIIDSRGRIRVRTHLGRPRGP